MSTEAGPLNADRSLVYELDTLQQKDAWQAFSPRPTMFGDIRPSPTTTAWISGVLRTADLLSKETIILDAQILDGAFFLHHGPENIQDLMAQTGSSVDGIRVAARQASLAESLRQMVLGGKKHSPNFANFEFSSLTSFGIDSKLLSKNLSQQNSHTLRDCPSKDVAYILAAELQAAYKDEYARNCPTGIFLELAVKWQAWIDIADARFLPMEVWGEKCFDMEEAFRSRPLPLELSAEAAISPDIQRHISFLKMNFGRSNVLSYLHEQRGHAASEYLEQLESWWMTIYFDALARQHGANWLQLNSGTAQRKSEAPANTPTEVQNVVDASDSKVVQFEGLLVGQLREMPPQVFALAKYKARYAIRQWQEIPDQNHSDELAYAILKATEPISRKTEQRDAGLRILLALIPAVLGLVSSSLASLTVGIWTVITSAVVLLLAVPLAELIHLHSIRSKRMKAYINFPRAIDG